MVIGARCSECEKWVKVTNELEHFSGSTQLLKELPVSTLVLKKCSASTGKLAHVVKVGDSRFLSWPFCPGCS